MQKSVIEKYGGKDNSHWIPNHMLSCLSGTNNFCRWKFMICAFLPLNWRSSHFLEACSSGWPDTKKLLPFKVEMNKLGDSFELGLLHERIGFGTDYLSDFFPRTLCSLICCVSFCQDLDRASKHEKECSYVYAVDKCQQQSAKFQNGDWGWLEGAGSTPRGTC